MAKDSAKAKELVAKYKKTTKNSTKTKVITLVIWIAVMLILGVVLFFNLGNLTKVMGRNIENANTTNNDVITLSASAEENDVATANISDFISEQIVYLKSKYAFSNEKDVNAISINQGNSLTDTANEWSINKIDVENYVKNNGVVLEATSGRVDTICYKGIPYPKRHFGIMVNGSEVTDLKTLESVMTHIFNNTDADYIRRICVEGTRENEIANGIISRCVSGPYTLDLVY